MIFLTIEYKNKQNLPRIKRLVFCSIFPVALQPTAVHGLFILEVSRSHTTTHHSQ